MVEVGTECSVTREEVGTTEWAHIYTTVCCIMLNRKYPISLKIMQFDSWRRRREDEERQWLGIHTMMYEYFEAVYYCCMMVEARRTECSVTRQEERKEERRHSWYLSPYFYMSRRKSKGMYTMEFGSCKCKARTAVGRGGEEPAMWPRIWVTTTSRRERKKEGRRWYMGWDKKGFFLASVGVSVLSGDACRLVEG